MLKIAEKMSGKHSGQLEFFSLSSLSLTLHLEDVDDYFMIRKFSNHPKLADIYCFINLHNA